jgi:transaldolase
MASTGAKHPAASDILYVKALAAPFTVNAMPEGTVKAFADRGGIGDTLPPMAATARTYWRNSRKLALISTRWRQNCKTMAPNRSSNTGTK